MRTFRENGDVLTGPHNFKDWFESVRLGFNVGVRIRVRLGLRSEG